MRIAVLGLGKMGSEIALRLERVGFDLTVWNRTRARAEDLGIGMVADTPAAAGRGVELVLTSLTGPEAVREVYLGPDGAAQGASGQLFVDVSTIGPDVVSEIDSVLRAHGSALVDAPVLGTVTAVESGSLVVLAGGAEADVARARPVLEALGEMHHVGGLGNGARLKLVANSMLGLVSLGGAELLAAGERSGLDRETVFSILAMYAPGLEGRRRGYVEGRHSPAMFAIRDMLKDLDLGLCLFQQAGAPVPLTALVRELVAETARTDASLDLSAVATRYAQPLPSPGRSRAVQH
jgi:3-hydroxyisobutyrate dehydrogenase-like beta-hydroxyacid dehydrogenase